MFARTTGAYARRAWTPAMKNVRRRLHGSRVAREEGNKPKSDSLHSSDIAFKPNNDGWGGTKKVSAGWDRIFGGAQGEVKKGTGKYAKQSAKQSSASKQ